MYSNLMTMMMVDERGFLKKPPPPEVVTTDDVRPWVLVVWNQDANGDGDMWVYGLYACAHDARMAAAGLSTFSRCAALPVEVLE